MIVVFYMAAKKISSFNSWSNSYNQFPPQHLMQYSMQNPPQASSQSAMPLAAMAILQPSSGFSMAPTMVNPSFPTSVTNSTGTTTDTFVAIYDP